MQLLSMLSPSMIVYFFYILAVTQNANYLLFCVCLVFLLYAEIVFFIVFDPVGFLAKCTIDLRGVDGGCGLHASHSSLKHITASGPAAEVIQVLLDTNKSIWIKWDLPVCSSSHRIFLLFRVP